MSFISSQIQVAIRVRPFLAHEDSNESILYLNSDDDRKITIRKSEQFFESYYDKVFNQEATQKDIYKFIKPLIHDIKKGINSTVFTYGQTGSGKTYTMFGSDWTDPRQAINYKQDKYSFIQNDLAIDAFSLGNGIIPKAINDIMPLLKDFNINCSYLQIYNEKIYDLLEDENPIMPPPKFTTYIKEVTSVNPIKQKSLTIREKKDSAYVDGLNEFEVDSFYDCLNVLNKGEKARKKRQTLKNDMSSRSHTIFILSLMTKNPDSKGLHKKSKVHFCDLAGSEKYDSNANYVKFHFNEMVNINKSLSTLGNVINALANKKQHIPYRDSKLTQLLQHTLGGNTKTFLIANIAPSKDSYEETISTLKFADCVHNVFTKVEPNTIEPTNSNIISQLTQELNDLKNLLNLRKKKGTLGTIEEELVTLRDENEKLKKNYTSSAQIDKLIKENKLLKDKIKKLSSRNTTSHSNVKESTFVLTGNNVVSNANSNYNYNYNHYLSNNYNGEASAIKKDLQTASSKLKALEELEYNSMLKMNKEIEMIRQRRKQTEKEKLFSRRKGKPGYLDEV